MLRKFIPTRYRAKDSGDALAITQFLELCHQDPFLAEIKDAQVIKKKLNDRYIIRARLGEEMVFCRFFLRDSDDTGLREWEEIQRIRPRMNIGELQVVRPLHVSAGGRILVTSEIEGKALKYCFVHPLPAPFGPISEKVISRLKHGRNPQQIYDNQAYFEQAARWLYHYSEGTEQWDPICPEEHLNFVAKRFERLPPGKFRKYELDILREVSRIGRKLTGKTWRTALSHGDLHSGNLIVNGRHMTGLDLDNSDRTPIYRDVARLLLNRSCRRTTLPSSRYLGVNRACLDAFVTKFDMNEEEQTLFLPFMIGCQSAERVRTNEAKPSHIRDDRITYDSLLEDLSQIRPI